MITNPLVHRVLNFFLFIDESKLKTLCKTHYCSPLDKKIIFFISENTILDVLCRLAHVSGLHFGTKLESYFQLHQYFQVSLLTMMSEKISVCRLRLVKSFSM